MFLNDGCGFANAWLHICAALASIVAVPHRAEDVARSNSTDEKDQPVGNIAVQGVVIVAIKDVSDRCTAIDEDPENDDAPDLPAILFEQRVADIIEHDQPSNNWDFFAHSRHGLSS